MAPRCRRRPGLLPSDPSTARCCGLIASTWLPWPKCHGPTHTQIGRKADRRWGLTPETAIVLSSPQQGFLCPNAGPGQRPSRNQGSGAWSTWRGGGFSRAYRCPQAWLGLDACSTHTAWLVPRAVHTPRPASGDVGLALPPSLEADRREGHLSLPGVASSANAQFTRGNRASVSA